LADVGQEEEHQERPSAAFDVGPPFHEVGESPKLTSMCQSSSLANCGDGKRIGGSETQWGKPAPIADQLVIGPMQAWRIGRLHEGVGQF
jgi:hypothetical protein